MSNKYKHGDRVPNGILCKRLDELSDAVTKGRDAINSEFYMSIPAQLDNDADLVIAEAGRRIIDLEKKTIALNSNCEWVRAFDGHFNISCANETGERANGNFKGKKDGATWDFIFCPYCGKRIQHPNKQAT